MKKILPIILTALVFGIGGYLIGGVQIGLKAARGSDIGTLMWITAIDQYLQEGKVDKAKIVCFFAAKAHFDLLKRLEDHPSSMLMEVFPWLDIDKKINEIVLAKAKSYYLPRASEMSPEAGAYLKSIKEVPVPDCANIKASTNNAPSVTP